MPLTGELEQLPIVDVIQLIHSTRKSGTLNVYSRKGEGQLVFRDGYIICATHSSDDLKIGKILVESKIITESDLKRALISQKLAGEYRKPLIATLHDHCGLSKDSAYKALETLIEMTVVEMVSWSRGVFTLDTETVLINDEYQYLPTHLQDVSLDTQMVLMDALRIFDEKVYAGEIKLIDEGEDLEGGTPKEVAEEGQPEYTSEEVVVSEDILGLADLDKIERKKPSTFQVLEAFDPADIHRQVIARTLPTVSDSFSDAMVDFLTRVSLPLPDEPLALHPAVRSQAVILYSDDEFLRHAVMTVCKREGILAFVPEDEEDVERVVDRTLKKILEPIVVFGCPNQTSEHFTKLGLMELRSQMMLQHPDISLIQLASPGDYSFSLESLNDGMRAVFPYPDPSQQHDAPVEDTIKFLNSFSTYIRSCFNEERRLQFSKLRNCLSSLRLLKRAPDISLLLLQFVGEFFPRSLTLIVDRDALIAERSIGIISDLTAGPAPPMKTRIPIRKKSLFQQVISSGQSFFGSSDDDMLRDLLYPEIGAPADPTVLLLPLKSNDRIITMTYADFGHQKAKDISLDFLEFFAGQAGISMENALFRKQLKNSALPDVVH